MNAHNEQQARTLLALGLDEYGHHTEAENVRNGIDLDDYKVDLWAIRAALDTQPAAAQEAVAYLDIGAGGYLDLGSDLSDEQLLALPKGRHALAIIGTYGIDGYVNAAAPVTAAPIGSDACPVTGLRFYDNMEHPERGMIAMYGGPFDVYSIPELGDDDELRRERYDLDRGDWVEGGEPLGYFYREQQLEEGSTPAAPGIDLAERVVELLVERGSFGRNGEHYKAVRALIDASPKATLNEQFGSAEGLGSPKGGSDEAAWSAGYRAAINAAAAGVQELYRNHVHHTGSDGLIARAMELEQSFIRDAAMQAQAGDAEVRP